MGADAVVRIFDPLPHRLALLGVAGVGLGWSLGVTWAHWPEVRASGHSLLQAVPLVVAGGTAMILSLWIGVAAVMWAMCRVCGRRVGLGIILLSLSASALVLWIVAPVAALVLAGSILPAGGLPWILIVAGLCAYCAQVVASLRRTADISIPRAVGCVALTAIFCGSFLSL
jgi:hypothetical protein